MAISKIQADLLTELAPKLQRGGALLHIGEPNWYGDADPRDYGVEPQGNLFDVARLFWQRLMEPSRVAAIDLHGTAKAWRHDLNQPLAIRGYDVVMNNGTAEHVFFAGQAFRTMHESCRVGGVMIHEAPFTGWVDHGFWSMHPTLFYDLAAANQYDIEMFAVEHFTLGKTFPIERREDVAALCGTNSLAGDTMLFVAFRKTVDAPLHIPMQGYYAGTLPAECKAAWEDR